MVDESTGVCDWFTLNVRRGLIVGPMRKTVGLIIKVSADPAVEELVKCAANERKDNVALYDNWWLPLNPLAELLVYKTPPGFGVPFKLDHVGGQLIKTEDERGGPYTNISLLRLAGISNPQGIEFGVVGAYSLNYTKSLVSQIINETKAFINSYVTPVNISVRLTSQR